MVPWCGLRELLLTFGLAFGCDVGRPGEVRVLGKNKNEKRYRTSVVEKRGRAVGGNRRKHMEKLPGQIQIKGV